jgi:hypothetical protein
MKVPRFKNLKEEREFWDTHDSTDYYDDFKITKNVVFVRPKKEVILFLLEPKFIRRLTLLLQKGVVDSVAYNHTKAVSAASMIPFKGHYWVDSVDHIDLTAVPLWVRV